MSTTITNDYERRFKRSLQKLAIPSWYTDITPSSSILNNSKQSINSNVSIPWKTDDKEPQRIPEIFYVRFPPNTRSCRSSLAASPSPSIHSWHPNYILDGSRRQRKYQKGIERVSNSSRWYQPTSFITNAKKNIPTGSIKVSASNKYKQHSPKNIHYDTSNIRHNDESLIFKSNHFVVNSDDEKNITNEPNTIIITPEKQQDNHIKSNESQIMPSAITKQPSSRIELEVVTDDERNNRSLSMKNNNLIPSITNIPSSIEKLDGNDVLLERIANDLVQSILSDIFISKDLDNDNTNNSYDYDNDDMNSGVRELSEDENGLRELDENDMNDMDEFIVFPTQISALDDDQTFDIPRCSLNKLYTFSKTNHQTSDHSKSTNSRSQNSPASTLENNIIANNSQANPTIEKLHDKPFISSPIDQQLSILDKFIDDITYSSHNQLAKYPSSEGVNEETARIGRLLLNSMPTAFMEDIHYLPQTSVPISSTFNSNYSIIPEQEGIYDSPRRDFDENPQGIIEELDEDEVLGDSAYSSNQERINIQQLLYEPLSTCYSGYSVIQSDFLTPNISSLQSTTDEAYESEPTTMSSSIAITTYVHPNLEHEFEYSSPPPPVPDRRLKPDYLKTSPPTKSRLTKQKHIDLIDYSITEKSKPLPPHTIQQIVVPTSNDFNSSSKRTMSSRHYCGSIPISDKLTLSCVDSPSTKSKDESHDKTKEKRNTRVLNCLHPSTADDDNNKRHTITKSSTSSLNKLRTKKHKLITDFDEATNGLAIRLPAPVVNSHKATMKRPNGLAKDQHMTHQIKTDRAFFYETSV